MNTVGFVTRRYLNWIYHFLFQFIYEYFYVLVTYDIDLKIHTHCRRYAQKG